MSFRLKKGNFILPALITDVCLNWTTVYIPMKKFTSMSRHNRARWILMFGVLAGLLFSGGEGIHLLPFPITEDNNSKNTAPILEKNLKSYAFSVHNSGNSFPLLKSKFQKDTNQYLPDGHSIFDSSNVRAELSLQSARYREKANCSRFSVFFNSPSDRAPPTV